MSFLPGRVSALFSIPYRYQDELVVVAILAFICGGVLLMMALAPHFSGKRDEDVDAEGEELLPVEAEKREAPVDADKE